jgi:hypothetical protein
MLVYYFDSNSVMSVAMKSRSSPECLRSYGGVHQELTSRWFKPKLHTMDNVAPAALQIYLTANDVSYQLMPPHCHRHNAAERAVHTSKEQFVAGLASVDHDLLIHLWDRLFPQAAMTLNLFWASRLHPRMSAVAHQQGRVDYNKTVFAPRVCNIIAHEKLLQWCTWAPHGKHRYSLGTSVHQYSYQKVYITSTTSERMVDTLECFRNNPPMPRLSSMDRLLMAAQDMTYAINHPHPDVRFATIGNR